MKEKLTKEQKSILQQCLWDRGETPEEFYDIIKGRSTPAWPSRAFCVARLLEYVNWFNIKKIFEPKEICALWNDEVRRYVRAKSTKEGMDFACRILHENTLSHTR
jgi:hypothetical protein